MASQRNRLVSFLRSVMPNAAWDAIKSLVKWAYNNFTLFLGIVGVIGSAITALINRLRGIPSDFVGVLVVFGVVVLVALISYIVGKVRDKTGTEVRDAASPPTERLVVLSGIESTNFDLEPNSLPFIEFVCTVFNAHQEPISISDAVTGRTKYQSQPLDKEPYIVKNDAKNIQYGSHGVFVLRQGLTRQECEQIRRLSEANPNAASNTKIDVTDVSVRVLGGDNTELCKLILPDRLKLPPAIPVKLISSSLLETLEQSTSKVDVHAECKKSIALLQESAALHSARADTNESIFNRFQEKYVVAIRVADYQAAEIGKFVEVVRVCTHEPKLDDPMPTIKWAILLKNRSVHRISLDGDVGPLFFEGHKLTEHKELLENKVMGLYPERDGSIVFEQRLSPAEVNLLKGSPNGKFEFDKVMLHVKGSDAEHVTSHRVVIFSRFRATLGRCSDERSQAVEQSAEVANLRRQYDEIQAQLKLQSAARLKFEIDVKRTEMQYRGYSDNGNITTIAALVRLRCSKVSDSKLAVRDFRAQLIREGDETVFDDGTLVRAYVDNEAKDNVHLEAGWTIEEPLTEFRFYDFMFSVSNQALKIEGRGLFVRITMNAIGQEPQHVDFFVDSWQDAIKLSSSISLRRIN